MKLTAEQIIALLQLIAGGIQSGKMAIEDLISFFESKGADAQQIANLRSLLVSDINSITSELKADGQL